MTKAAIKFSLLDADELDTIAAIAKNGQSGRVTEYEITELVAGYRAASSMLDALQSLNKWFESSGSSIDARWSRIPPVERAAIVKATREAIAKATGASS